MRIIFRSLALASALAGALAAAPRLAHAQEGYKIVVNAANPVTSLRQDEVSQLFLKRVTRWPDHKPVTVVDMLEGSPVRREFSREVHKREVRSVKIFWQQQVFSGRAVPPVERASDADVMDYVAQTPSAIGYVAASTPLGAGVKAVKVER